MKEFIDTIKPFLKRPGIIIVLSILTLFYCVMEYNFIFPLVSGLSYFNNGNVLNNVIHFIQISFGFIFNTVHLLYILIAIILISLMAGVFLSGALYTLNRALDGRDIVKGEFITGVKKYFIRIFLISARVLSLSLLFCIFVVVAVVPSIVVINAYIMGKKELLTLVILFGLITIGVIFFASMFFRTYMLFWYPAAINLTGKFFAIGKHVADTCFWHIVFRLILVDLAFISFEGILFYLNHIMPFGDFFSVLRVIILIFINWFVKTSLITMLILFVFSKFILYKRSMS